MIPHVTHPPRRPDPLGIVGLGTLLVGLAILAHVLAGCGASAIADARYALAGTARIGAQIDRDLAAERLRVSAEIIARPDATRAEHDAAMAFFGDALAATRDVRDAHLATEAALDAAEHGAAQAWMPLMACVLSSTARLVGIAARRITVPPEAGAVLSVLVALAEGACVEPVRAEDGGDHVPE